MLYCPKYEHHLNSKKALTRILKRTTDPEKQKHLQKNIKIHDEKLKLYPPETDPYEIDEIQDIIHSMRELKKIPYPKLPKTKKKKPPEPPKEPPPLIKPIRTRIDELYLLFQHIQAIAPFDNDEILNSMLSLKQITKKELNKLKNIINKI